MPSPARAADDLARDRPAGEVETVATFDGPMPTGVTVSHTGRIFVCYPKWGDKVDFTVAEVKQGKPIAYPDQATNQASGPSDGQHLISVQSVVIDPSDRLWAVDTGSVEFGPTSPGGPELVCIDRQLNKVSKIIPFPPEVVLPTSYINDVRFDLRRGEAGYAFLTDSSDRGPNGIIVVDLASGRSWRRLHDHPTTKADPAMLALVEGRPVMERPPGLPKPVTMGSDGIAIAHDGSRLFLLPAGQPSPLQRERRRPGRRRHPGLPGGDHGPGPRREGAVRRPGVGRPGAGLRDELRAGRRAPPLARRPVETLVHDPRVLWPDTLSVARDGHLYFTANQLYRQGPAITRARTCGRGRTCSSASRSTPCPPADSR